MEKELFTQLFKKLKENEEVNNETLHGCFDYYRNYILGNINAHPIFVISTKSLVNYYKKYVENKENNTGSPRIQLKDLIAQYLDFENYEDYKKQLPFNTIIEDPKTKKTEEPKIDQLQKKTSTLTPSIKWHKKYANELSIFSSVLFVLIFSSYIYQNNYAINNNCIVWKEYHYEKSSCLNIKAINNSKYNINIERFEKIMVTDSTRFFINGKPIAWYGENKKGINEYFTNRGFHPETRKELKLVSRAILYRDGKLNE